jgi:ribosomal protein S18 acetylase RimI-like enzyme
MDEFAVLWLTQADQITQAVGVAARSLQDGPDSMAVSDDLLVRLEMLYSTFAGSLDGARVAGVRRGDCVLGAASAVELGNCVGARLPPEIRTLDAPSEYATDADRFLHFGSTLTAHDLDEPHWHVGPVGVEPGFQSMGMGRAVMRLLCEELDEHSRVAWLETAKPENVRFYIGLGFEVVEESPMLSAHLWFSAVNLSDCPVRAEARVPSNTGSAGRYRPWAGQHMQPCGQLNRLAKSDWCCRRLRPQG